MKGPVLVTGGATRIGRVIAGALKNAGYPVIIHYRGSADSAAELAQELDAQMLQGDLCDAEDVARMIASMEGRTLGGIVNNASAFFRTPVGEASLADWEALFGSNAKGPFFLSQGLAHCIEEGGAIVNITDIHAERPLRGHVVYSMAKAALAQMTRSMAQELAPRIRVNAVAPGAITWPVQEPSAAVKQKILSQIPLGRLGEADDVARTVVFLFQSPYVTGETIRVDGGRSL